MALTLTGFWNFLHQYEEKRAYRIQVTPVLYSRIADTMIEAILIMIWTANTVALDNTLFFDYQAYMR